MAYSHVLTQSVNIAGNTITKQNTYSGDARESRQIPVAADQTDKLVDFVLDVSEIKSLYMVSDQDLTVETNNGGSPIDTFGLLAGKPLLWQNDSLHANPFSVDVTALYLTNTLACTFQLEVVFDSTP